MNGCKKIAPALGLLLASCALPQTIPVMAPQGLVDVKNPYPQFEAIHTRHQIRLSLADQDRFRRYYRTHRNWPLGLPGFVAASDSNYQFVTTLRRRGFTDLDFISRGNDTLRMRFIFQTLGNLQFDENAGVSGIGRAIKGSFVFVADPVSGISFRQEMDKPRKKWYQPFGKH